MRTAGREVIRLYIIIVDWPIYLDRSTKLSCVYISNDLRSVHKMMLCVGKA